MNDLDMKTADLAALEAVALGAFRLAASALRAIRDRELFKPAFRSWEDYCDSSPSWTRSARHARRLLAALRVADNIESGPSGSAIPPSSERQLRPLTGLPAEGQREVWREANSGGGAQPSGARIAQLASQWATRQPTPAEQSRDRAEEEADVLQRAEEAENRTVAHLKGCRALKKAIRHFEEAGAIAVVLHLRALVNSEKLG